METGKLKKRFWPAFVYLVILMLLTAVVEYAYYKDYAYYNIVCFAVDSRGRVLLGKVARVDIYENNVLTDSIEIPLRRAYSINPMRNVRSKNTKPGAARLKSAPALLWAIGMSSRSLTRPE